MPTRVSWKLNLIMLWFSQLLIIAGFQALIPFIPLFIKNELGITDDGQLANAVTAFNFFGSMAYAIFCPIWGVLSDRFGVKPMLLRGTFVTAVIFPLMAYSKTVWLLVFLRFLSAACAGTTAASQTMIVRNTPNEKQGFSLGVLTTAIWGGAMLGNVVGGLIIHCFDYIVAFWFCGILYFIGGISILFTRDGAIRSAQSKSRVVRSGLSTFLPDLSKAVWIMLWLFMLMGVIRGYEVAYIALRIEELTSSDVAAFWTGITSAGVCIAAILSGIMTGYLVDRLKPLKILIPVMCISAVALILQGIASKLWLFAVSRMLLYTAAGGLQPLIQKVLSSITPPRKRGSSFGFASLFQNLGAMLAAVLSGITMKHFGVPAVFYAAGCSFIIALPLIISGIKAASRPPVFHRLKRSAKTI